MDRLPLVDRGLRGRARRLGGRDRARRRRQALGADRGRPRVAGARSARPRLPPARHLRPRPLAARPGAGGSRRCARAPFQPHPCRRHRRRRRGVDAGAPPRRLQSRRRPPRDERRGRGLCGGTAAPRAAAARAARRCTARPGGARGFYSERRRVANGKMVRVLGYRLRYPDFRAGLRAIHAERGT